jgi:hypothetical protein
MTEYEKRVRVKDALDNIPEATDKAVDYCLLIAKSKILNRLNNDKITEVPEKYVGVQLDLAVRYFNKKGAEGESAHDENGIKRVYGSVNDEDLLSEVTPYAKVVY